ncbi:alpha-2-macroglobulin family protein [Levilinea saccharolytica]|uniref:alpha-2-macroglobulin family protein n=2 Tax=Levilinea saccharolytica TaxID=229921 RepID=UPI000B0E0275|nr:alpha-2-macroglobulin family protein [Levilinea saccharolytica]
MHSTPRRFLSQNIFPAVKALLFAAVGVSMLVSCAMPAVPAAPQPVPIESNASQPSGGEALTTQSPSPEPFQVSEGQPQPQPTPTAAPVESQPLEAADVQALLGRLPALVSESGDTQDFRLAQGPLPPPRSGETTAQPFPPSDSPQTAPTVEAGPLEVLRYSPEGEISVAPFLSITFNQPMVALSTLQQLSEKEVPVQLEPPLPGIWRWVGTKTLTFEYESDQIDRLPKATQYRATVPAGTRSAQGGQLAQAVTWTFSTPPPKLITSYPSGVPQPADPLFFIAFDQRIDPQQVLAVLKVQAGGRNVGIKLAGEEAVRANPQTASLLKNTPEGRWLAFQAQEPLPLDSTVSVTIPAGTPSAEGPLRTAQDQSYQFSTYAPLKILEHGCSSYEEECRPLTPFFVRFNNPLDSSAFQDGFLSISPELAGVSANIYGDTLQIQGDTRGQTTYTLTLSGQIQDVFGQTLGKDAVLKIKVGKASPILVGSQQNFITLDPAASKPVFTVYTINMRQLDVQIYAVRPNDWPAYLAYQREYSRNEGKAVPPGRRVFDKAVNVEAAADALTQVDIDLKPYMDGEFGHFIVIVQPHKTLFSPRNYWETVQSWVQITQIGLDAVVDHSQMVAWATALKDGSPLAEVKISAGSGAAVAATGSDGVASFPIPDGAAYLVASQGSDQAILTRSGYYWDDSTWATRPVLDELRWYVFDDRQMYRPGEEVHIKGWLRRIGGKQNGDVSLPGEAVSAVTFTITEPQGNQIGTGQANVNPLGGFDFTFTIPQAVNLGQAYINLQAQGGLGNLSNTAFGHGFQIQEFRRPEFEVTARNESSAPYFAGESAVVAVEAKYYAGGALPNAEVVWQVSSAPGSYSPPNWPDFTFGSWTPWWYYGKGGPYGYDGPNFDQSQTFTGQTDASGTHFLKLDFGFDTQPRPRTFTAQATVMDVNRQAWTSQTSLLVHPANLYVGLRTPSYFVKRGIPLDVDIIVTDLDGKPVVDRPVEVRAARLEWKFSGGSWRQQETDVQTCRVGSASEAVRCTFETPLGGSYQITAQISDEAGRLNQTQITRWVSGEKRPAANRVEQESVSLIPNQNTYQPGDTAEVLVQSPFSPAQGLLTVSRSGILYTESFAITDGTAVLRIPIRDEHIPNLNLQVDLTGSAPRTDERGEPISDIPARPAYARGELTLDIPPVQRTLTVEAQPEQAEIEPGAQTAVSVTVRSAQGQPVKGAEVAVFVVDEAVLALSQYTLQDPLSLFYSHRSSDTESYYTRASVLLIDPRALAQQAQAEREMKAGAGVPMPAAAPMATMVAEAAPQDMAFDGANAAQPVRIRVDFNPLAVFAPTVQTDANGQARVPFTLPDNLTRYRIMAVAVEDGRNFGTGEANLTARLPLMVRPSAPRFLNFGDRFELPVVLQNQTDSDLSVDVALRAANLTLTGSAGYRLTVPARDRVEVRFPAAAVQAGTARFQVVVAAGSYSDAAEGQFPIYTPATTEAFATYGVVDQGAVYQPLETPRSVFPQFGGLEINTSSTALQALTDAVLYLSSYPFECSEQLASRVLGIAALRDVLTAFKAEGLPAPADLEAAVQRDIDRLKGMQNGDGGFPYWRRGQESIPFNTIHAAHALQRAQDKGFTVPPEMQAAALMYLQQIENYYPYWYGEQTRQTLSAYAMYVRALMGDRDTPKALKLLDQTAAEKMNLDTLGWIWGTLAGDPQAASQLEKIRREVNNRVVETAGAANFTTAYDDQTYLLLASDRRTDAILLDALIRDTPQSDLIPKVVNGLLSHRTAGRWGSTQENVFVLLALDRYFNTYEAQTPDFVARIWLGEGYAGSHEYRGRTTERQETTIPMQYLTDAAAGSLQNLVLSKEGAGRLYYRLGLRYAPTDLNLPAADQGFVVQRVYEAVDDPADVRQQTDGSWVIRAGAKVRVRITLVADNRRYHVALVDPLPAGLEILNPALAVTADSAVDPISQESQRRSWWWGPWYEHQNLRDERAEAFTSLLWDGVYTYSYIARATTPGQFVVPPAKAEEMYSPEVFGRSASDRVTVQ